MKVTDCYKVIWNFAWSHRYSATNLINLLHLIYRFLFNRKLKCTLNSTCTSELYIDSAAICDRMEHNVKSLCMCYFVIKTNEFVESSQIHISISIDPQINHKNLAGYWKFFSLQYQYIRYLLDRLNTRLPTNLDTMPWKELVAREVHSQEGNNDIGIE